MIRIESSFDDASGVVWPGDADDGPVRPPSWGPAAPSWGDRSSAPLGRVRTSVKRPVRTRQLRPAADLDRVRSVIVDDSDGFVSLVSRQLVTDGFDVVGVAANRDQGLRLVYDLCPDVALVDLFLGAGNGLELIADIVCSGLADEMFVILISSCAADDLRELFECSVADGYLSKLEMSGDAVRSILGGMGTAQTGTAQTGNGHSRNGRGDIAGDGSA